MLQYLDLHGEHLTCIPAAMEQNGDSADSRSQPHMEFLQYHCNFIMPNKECCGKTVGTGWITACSHLFCQEHAKEWFTTNNECPICRAGAVKLVHLSFSRGSHDRKTRTTMVGMLPTEIILATEVGLQFWLDQKVHEYQARQEQQIQLQQKQKGMEDHIRRELEVSEKTCEKMEDEHQQILHQIRTIDESVSKAENELKDVSTQIADAEHRYNSLQQRIAGNQREEFFRRPFTEANSPTRHSGRLDMNRAAPPMPMERDQDYGACRGAPRSGLREQQHVFRENAEPEWRNRQPPLNSRQDRGGSVHSTLFGTERRLPQSRAAHSNLFATEVPTGAPSTGRRRAPLFTPGCMGSRKRRILGS